MWFCNLYERCSTMKVKRINIYKSIQNTIIDNMHLLYLAYTLPQIIHSRNFFDLAQKLISEFLPRL